MSGTPAVYNTVVKNTTAGYASIDGFISDTANYTPTQEPLLTNPTLQINGQNVDSATFYQFNPTFDELTYDTAMYNTLVAAGFPSSKKFLIDTSRNGWGPTHPTTITSASDVNTYVADNKIDARPFRGDWCNQNNAGIGARPTDQPFGSSSPILAFVWIKPPGESDGDYPTVHATRTATRTATRPARTPTATAAPTPPAPSRASTSRRASGSLPSSRCSSRTPSRRCRESDVMTRTRRILSGLAALALSAAGLGASALTATPANAATGCSVAYTVPSQWNTGFTANIVITNLGSPLTSWNLGYSYGGNQTLQSGWNGTWTQSGANVTVANASWNGSVATNGTVTIGANFNYSGTNTSPTTFTLNGVTCTGSVTGTTGSIVASPTTLSVTQGSTGTFGLSLSAAPSANVTVTTTRTSGDSGLTVTGGGTLTFTPPISLPRRRSPSARTVPAPAARPSPPLPPATRLSPSPSPRRRAAGAGARHRNCTCQATSC